MQQKLNNKIKQETKMKLQQKICRIALIIQAKLTIQFLKLNQSLRMVKLQ